MAVVHDNHTKTLNLPLPDKDNFLQDDVQRLIETINTLDEKVATKDASGRLDPAQLPTNAATLAGDYLDPAQIPPLVAQRNAQTGKIPSAILPREGLTNVMDASNQAAMLNLNATIGDIARRIDTNSYFMLVGSPSTERASWRELPQTAVYSVNGKVGAVTGIAASGVNHDITDLTGLTGQLHLPVDGADDMAAVTKRQLDKAGGGYVSQVVWHHNRTSIPDGYLLGDGEEIAQTLAPTLFEAVQAGRVPVCTEAEWWANPGKRGCYTLGATPGMFRVPDYNGAQSGSFSAPFLRGSLPSDFAYKGWIQGNAAPNITGLFGRMVNNGQATLWESNTNYITGPFRAASPINKYADLFNWAPATAGKTTIITAAASSYPSWFSFDASRSSIAYGRVDPVNGKQVGEVRPNAVVGCYIIRFAGRALEPGAVDPVATATKLQELYDDVKKLNNVIGYELLDFGTLAPNSRRVMPNPFGNNTPVIVKAEINSNGKWTDAGFGYLTGLTPSTDNGGYGVGAYYSEGEGIVVQCGNVGTAAPSNLVGNGLNNGVRVKDAQHVRVHIWNMGNDTTQLELQRVAVSKLSDLWLPWNDSRVTEYIHWGAGMGGPGSGATDPMQEGELLVNIKANAIHIHGILRKPFTATDRTVLTVIKMLPGFTRIPRVYAQGFTNALPTRTAIATATGSVSVAIPALTATGTINVHDTATKNVNFSGRTAATTVNATASIPAANIKLNDYQPSTYAGMNDGNTAINEMKLAGSDICSWFFMDVVIPFM